MTKDSTTTPAEAGKDWFTTYTVFLSLIHI